MKKIVLLAFVLVLLSTAVVVRFVRPVVAQGTIYIRSYGSVDPPTAPIQRDGDVYTFIDNIYDSIVVERDNIMVDGAGYTIQGTGAFNSKGISLSRRSNVAIKNTNIQSFVYGIYLYGSSNNVISGNNITANGYGILLYSSSNNNTLSENNITANNEYGISIYMSYNNTVSGNNVTNNRDGIALYKSSYNSICGNNVTNNVNGIFLNNSYDNKFYHNNFIGNAQQVGVLTFGIANFWDDGYPLGGNFWSDYTGVDANGDGIGDTPYILDANNRDRYPLMSICGAWKPTFISISTSSPSTLLGLAVNITGTLYHAYENGLENKTVVLYYTFPGANAWVLITSDTTDHLGHYSVKWIPPATGYFTIKAEWAGNATHFTASNSITLSTMPFEDEYVFSVESNSTISGLAFNAASQELSFTASGPSGTRGYVKVTIAKSLVADIINIRVYLEGNQTEYSITSMDDSWLLTFDYMHSSHQIVIELNPNRIPATTFLGLDWWLWVIIIVVVVGALSAAAFILRRRKPPTPIAPPLPTDYSLCLQLP